MILDKKQYKMVLNRVGLHEIIFFFPAVLCVKYDR